MSLPSQSVDSRKDRFKGKYVLKNTPLKVDLGASRGDIVIDLGTGTLRIQ